MRIFIKKKKKENEKNVLLKTKMSWRDPILFFSSKSIKKNCKKTKNKNEKNVLLERKKLWSDPRQTRC